MTRVSAIWFPKQEVVLYMQARDLTKLQMEWCYFPSMSLGPRLLPVSPDSALTTFPALPACHTLPASRYVHMPFYSWDTVPFPISG